MGETTSASTMLEMLPLERLSLCLEDYGAIPKDERSRKHRFLERLVQTITKSGGRFLRRQPRSKDQACWTEVSLADARQKVSHELRDAIRSPRILHHFSHLDSPRLSEQYNSVSSFDWGGIIEACKFQMETDKVIFSTATSEEPFQDMESGETHQTLPESLHSSTSITSILSSLWSDPLDFSFEDQPARRRDDDL